MKTTPLGRLDAALGRLPMYRVASLALGALVLWSYFLVLTDSLITSVFSVPKMTVSLVLLLAVSVVANQLIGRLVGVRAHTESAVITALLLWFLFWPAQDATGAAWLAGAALAATASKYLIAVRGRHLINPAAAGVVIVTVIGQVAGQPIGATWWVANEPSLIPVLLGALLLLVRTRRLDLGLVFVGLATVFVVAGQVNSGAGVLDAARALYVSSPVLFLAGFMLSEPLTLPPRRPQQLAVAALAAVVYAWPSLQTLFLADPWSSWVLGMHAELALVASGLAAFAWGQRGGVRLRLLERRQIAGEVWEFRFEPRRRLRFRAGQYLELGMPHRHPDGRGVRRPFSIVSPPEDDAVAIALRVPEKASSYKRALMAAEPGTRFDVTTVAGDFLLPRTPAPMVLVAGGIGVTPFLSQLRSEEGREQDVVLVYGVNDADEVAYRDELEAAGTRVVLVAPQAPSAPLPPGWTHVEAPYVSAEAIASAVPDLASRTAYLSGPPAMVDALRSALRGDVAGVRTDAFAGY